MNRKLRSSFDWKTFIRNVAVIAIPIALQNLLTSTASMVDTIMIAPLGETSVAAVGLCGQFASLMFSCYWGFVGGGMLFFAQYYGAQDDDGIDRAYGMTCICMMTDALVFATLALFFPQTVMRLYTDKQGIQVIGVRYLKVVGVAYIFQVWSTLMSSLLRSTERVKIPLYASIASVSTNIVLNYLFIYGKLGLPAMKEAGAALATTCAAFVNSAVILILSRKAGYPYLFHFRKHFCMTKAFVKEYFAKCFPILCNELLIGVGNMVINIVLGRQSESAIAAVAVLRTFEGLVIGFFAGFSNAASVLVGANVGAGKLEVAYERAKRLVPLCGGTILCTVAAILALHTPLLHLMSLSGESFEICTGLLIIYCVVAVIRMCNWVQNDTYRSAGDAIYGTVLEIVFMYCVVLPAVCFTGLKLKAHIFIVFACCYCDEPIRFVLMQIHMYSGKWIRPVTEQGKKAVEEFRAARLRRKDPA